MTTASSKSCRPWRLATFWLAGIAALLISPTAQSQQTAEKSSGTTATDWKKFTTENSERIAYGIYLNGKKMGWTTEQFGLAKLNSEEVARLTSISVLQVTFQGKTIDFESETIFHYRLDADRDRILDLWRENLPESSPDRYGWLYEDGPSAGWLVKSDETDTVGAVGLMRRTIKVFDDVLRAESSFGAEDTRIEFALNAVTPDCE